MEKSQRITSDSSLRSETDRVGYMICASPRSGSTLLCDLLAQTGVAGAPKSYFRPDSIPVFAGDGGATNATNWNERYVTQVRRESTSENGCFGFRIMWSDMPPFLRRAETLQPDFEQDYERLNQLLGVQHFIHLYRENKVAQAVSLVIAQQTGTWHLNADGSVREGSDDPHPVRYDHNFIKLELRMLEDEHASWTRWFETQRIAPLAISYEALAAHPIATAKAVLKAIGTDDPVREPKVLTSALASDVNKAWVDKFRSTR